MTYKTQGIILRHQDWQDFSRLYFFYTKDRGKLSLIARGVRKIKSKQNGKLTPFSIIEVMIANGKKIDTLATAEIIKDFPNLKKNLVALGVATFCLELVDRLTGQEAKEVKVYKLLDEVLTLLNENINANDELLKALGWVFGLKLIELLGFGPDLYHCVNCQADLRSPYSLAPRKGGLVCDKHVGQEECVAVAAQDVDILRQILKISLSDFMEISLDGPAANKLSSNIKHLLLSHLEGDLKSEKFLEKLTV